MRFIHPGSTCLSKPQAQQIALGLRDPGGLRNPGRLRCTLVGGEEVGGKRVCKGQEEGNGACARRVYVIVF